jgi:hypothetical protein
MDMADQIEEIMMEAYAYGIHGEVLDTVTQIQHQFPHDRVALYETAFQQTMSRYEQPDSEN